MSATTLSRIDCWLDTRSIAAAIDPPPPSEKVVWTGTGVARESQSSGCAVEVVDLDTIEAAVCLLERGLRPLVLNLADDAFPGGCVDTGSGAQEESLFRCTNLCRTLDLNLLPRGTYPLTDASAVVSPGVTVLKASERRGWTVLKDPRPKLDFIACPALYHPPILDDGRLPSHLAELLAKKVALVMDTALARGNDAVVLGAMGCGAWRSPPAHVAEVMREVIDRYRGAFAVVQIAILSGTHEGYLERLPGGSNLAIFRSVFQDSGLELKVAEHSCTQSAPHPLPDAMATPTPPSTIPVKDVDYLDCDKPIRNQNFACISFLSPEDALKDKYMFFMSKFLSSFARDADNMLSNLAIKYPGDAELFKVIRENHDFVLDAERLPEQFRFYSAANSEALERDFHEQRNFQTTIRGFKIRGVYDTQREAQVRSEVLKRSGDRHSIYICQVGAWCPWSPNPDEISDSQYAETQLNTLMKAYRDQEQLRDEEYERRKSRAVATKLTEDPDAWVERKKAELAPGSEVVDADGSAGAPKITVEVTPGDPSVYIGEKVESIKI